MGTHPIFESDFDCLTDGIKILKFGMTAEAIMAPGCSSHRETTEVFNEHSEKDYYESLSNSEKSTIWSTSKILESTSVRCFFNTNVLNTGHLHVSIGIFKTKGVANQYKNLINLSTIPPISTAANIMRQQELVRKEIHVPSYIE